MTKQKTQRHKSAPSSVPASVDPSDEDLMMQYASGNEIAFETLYKRYKAKAYGYISKQVRNSEAASEVFQSVMLKLHRSREQFQTDRVFAAWFFAICRSTIVDHFRTESRQLSTVALDENTHAIHNDALSSSEWLPDEFARELSSDQQKALRMRFESGFEFKEIARELATTQDNVRQMLSRAVKKIRSLMKETN